MEVEELIMPDGKGAIDLATIMKGAGLPTDLPPEMARGLDLNVVRNRKKHQHRWSATGRYLITDEQATDIQVALDAAKTSAKAQEALGQEVTPVAINVPLVGELLMAIEGPGCIKCGQHITSPIGFGKFCEKSDDEFPGIAELYANVKVSAKVDSVEESESDSESDGDGDADIVPIA